MTDVSFSWATTCSERFATCRCGERGEHRVHICRVGHCLGRWTIVNGSAVVVRFPMGDWVGGNLAQDPTEWLTHLFSDENCAECGGDERDHDAIPLLDNWFARCRSVPARSFVEEAWKR